MSNKYFGDRIIFPEWEKKAVELYKSGLSPLEIKHKLELEHTSIRQIQRWVKKAGVTRNKSGRLIRDQNFLAEPGRSIIIATLKKQGKDFTKCEQCNKPLTMKTFQFHHTKYQDATVFDLQVICKLCNLASKNRGIQ